MFHHIISVDTRPKHPPAVSELQVQRRSYTDMPKRMRFPTFHGSKRPTWFLSTTKLTCTSATSNGRDSFSGGLHIRGKSENHSRLILSVGGTITDWGGQKKKDVGGSEVKVNMEWTG